MSDRENLAELIKQADDRVLSVPYIGEDGAKALADYIIEDGWIKPLWNVGDKVWVIDREDGEAVDISCIQFLAKSEGFVGGTAWINDLDINGTIEYLINETQDNFGTDLKVYPDSDCFLTEEEAESNALKEENNKIIV